MGLQLSQDEALGPMMRMRRVGWSLLALFVLAAALGLLGGAGPLSWTTSTSEDPPLEIEFQRFAHVEADDQILVTVGPEAIDGDALTFELDRTWVTSVTILGITPSPTEVTATDYGLRITVPVQGDVAVPLQINYRASDIGPVDGGVRVRGAETTFQQFVYP